MCEGVNASIAEGGKARKGKGEGCKANAFTLPAFPLPGFTDFHTVTGFGFDGSMPYFLIAAATVAAGTFLSSASALSAATVT